MRTPHCYFYFFFPKFLQVFQFIQSLLRSSLLSDSSYFYITCCSLQHLLPHQKGSELTILQEDLYMLPGQRSRVLKFFNSNVFFPSIQSFPYFSHLHIFFSKLKNMKKLNRRKNITEYFPAADDCLERVFLLVYQGRSYIFQDPFQHC